QPGDLARRGCDRGGRIGARGARADPRADADGTRAVAARRTAPSSRERLTRLPLSAPFPILPRMNEAEAREQKAFADLVAVCRRLRGPGGCPWDQEQTLETMTPYLVEEAAEVGEA